MEENRFSDRYAHQQVDWYCLKTYSKNGVEVRTKTLRGRADEYLNKRFWKGELDVPTFLINGALWMSLTPLEIQSMILPIGRAWGYVGTGGLGMGYFALKCAEKHEVSEVKVWETNEYVIEFFNTCFSHRKGFEKIKIFHGDAREIRNQQFSYFFMDIYFNQLGNETIEDLDNFWRHQNDAGTYEFWCQDWALFSYFFDHKDTFLEADEAILLSEFITADLHPDMADNHMMKQNLFRPLTDTEFRDELVRDYLGR